MDEYLSHQAGPKKVVSFADFMRQALYAPGIGYYTREGSRVGRNWQSDFYTAANLGPLFARLVLTAVKNLLSPRDPAVFTFVEIGAEPECALLHNCNHPFMGDYVVRVGEPIAPLPDKAVVFANELLDAQPFHRLRFVQGHWREVGVRLEGKNLTETLLPHFTPEVTAVADILPPTAPDGYLLDLSLGAEALLKTIVEPHWKGLFLTFDYGKNWAELIHHCPNGTARAYYRHRLEKELLARPGEQDLTCHLCWDRLENILRQNGFTPVLVERQEAFFVRRAQDEISRLINRLPKKFDPSRGTLQEILHPIHMGHEFQVLWGVRE